MHFRTATTEDLSRIKSLYQDVARQGGGLARTESEITDQFIGAFLHASLERGLIIVGEHPEKPDQLIAEIHAYQPGPAALKHLFSDLTMVVDPAFQGKKIGRTLFTIFLEEVGLNRADVGRVELIVRESNQKGIKFYQSFGFQIEGRLEMRIKTADGNYEADIPMSWQNPNFAF